MSHFASGELVPTLAPIFSMASETGYPTAGIELGRGARDHHWAIWAFEPLMQVQPSALAHLRRITMPLSMAAPNVEIIRDEGLRYMLSLSASRAELNIIFCHRDRRFLTFD
jgi:hypothetical protein